MSEKQKIYKPKAISGFPEWLPEERLVEQRWLDQIRGVFESHGFCSIETPSVEEIDVLLAKGEVDKEIYVLERLHKDEDEDGKEARLALHFDQTVPFARYTAQHFNDLVFPFKRYQMQRVWRGERPQMGRMREFTQCDIDVINVDNLPLQFDADVAAVAYEALEALNIGKVQLRISNRKILKGFIEETGTNSNNDVVMIMRALDKLEKIGKEKVKEEITNYFISNDYTEALNKNLSISEIDLRNSAIMNLINFAETKFVNSEHIKVELQKLTYLFEALNNNKIFNEGIEELCEVLDNLSHLPEDAVVADLSIVRGLDYYTGTVYETQLLDVPEFVGSVCSGGRYDDLASQYINKKLPGVGISIGFSRLFDVMRQSRPDLLNIGPKSPADILIYTEEKDLAQEVAKTAQTLRKQGLKVESYHTVKKWDKHFKYAEKKQIPYIWYVKADGHEVKDMASGDQAKADPKSWEKP